MTATSASPRTLNDFTFAGSWDGECKVSMFLLSLIKSCRQFALIAVVGVVAPVAATTVAKADPLSCTPQSDGKAGPIVLCDQVNVAATRNGASYSGYSSSTFADTPLKTYYNGVHTQT